MDTPFIKIKRPKQNILLNILTILYNTLIVAAKGIIGIIGIFNPRIRLFKQVRKNQVVPEKLEGCIWIHCASLGEFEQGRPVIEAIRLKWPDKKIALSFFSSSGYDIRKNYDQVDWVGFLPFDTKRDARIFIDTLKPSIVIFVKYEFWFNHLDRLIACSIPFIFISSYWWEGHFLLQPWNKWLIKKVKMAKAIFVQDERSMVLLRKAGYQNAILAGDTRIDRVLTIKNQNEHFPEFNQLSADKQVLIAGSTWPEDENIIKQWYNPNKAFTLIIVPHDVSESRIIQVLKLFEDYAPILFSDWKGEAFNVLIVNKIGLLNKLYRYADVAYIGGGFGKGIHNTLEAAVYGIPVIFGPNHKSFREAIDLIESEIGFSFTTPDELGFLMNSFTKEKLRKIRIETDCYFNQNKGASELIVNYLSRYCL